MTDSPDTTAIVKPLLSYAWAQTKAGIAAIARYAAMLIGKALIGAAYVGGGVGVVTVTDTPVPDFSAPASQTQIVELQNQINQLNATIGRLNEESLRR